MVEKLWLWLVYSSTNKDKIALTIKGAIGTVLVTFSIFAGDINLPLLGDSINAVIDTALMVLQTTVGTVSAVAMLVGAVRKLYSTFVGKNDVVLGFRK